MTMTLDSGQYELVEYACHEANYSMTNSLSAARAEEAKQRSEIGIVHRIAIRLHGVVGARPEQLARERQRHVNRRNVVDVRLEAILRKQRQGDLPDMD